MAALSEVLWIGGSVCSGKTTVARHLGDEHGVAVYHYDDFERAHRARLGLPAEPDYDELWLRRTAEDIADRRWRGWRRRFAIVLEDLASFDSERVVVAEGIGLFPALVAPMLRDRRRAVWLVASPAFLPVARRKRGMSLPSLTTDPARAERNLIESDLLIAARVAHEALRAGLPVIDVDERTPLAAVSSEVERRLGPFLTR